MKKMGRPKERKEVLAKTTIRFRGEREKQIHKAIKILAIKKETTMDDMIKKATIEKYGNEIDEIIMKGEI